MKHETGDRVAKLVSSLSPAEKDVLFKHLSSSLPEWQSRSKLADLATELSTPDFSNDSAYNRKNYEMLETRILDTLLFDINLTRNGKQTSTINDLLNIRKDGLKMRVLQQRGLLHRAYQMAENIKQKAIRDEGYDEIIEALNFQLSMIGLQQDAAQFRELITQINHYEYCRFARRKSLALLYELKMKKFYGMEENLDLFVKDSIITLQRYSERIHCRTIEFISGYFIKEDLELEGNWHEAHYYMTRLFKKAEALPPDTPHFSFWELAYEQGRLCLKNGDHENGIFLLSKCIAKLPPEDLAHQKSVELTFASHYENGHFEEALRIAEDFAASHFYTYYLRENSRQKWNFMKSCTCFRMGDLVQSKAYLENTREFEKQNMLNNLQVRFLKIILAVESQNPDLADHYVEAMRKMVSRNQWLPSLKKNGLDAFYYALFKLRNSGYRLDELFSGSPEMITALRKANRKLNSSPEKPMISYWEWVQQYAPALQRKQPSTQQLR
ncbi:MAG TPA: hypothetical protein DCG19_00150 [Cryomorphaceae bacterium]|nr:hypothetical protein [Owenweeksia sp.]MBF98369.1 hypothetical protein [Owenweeksia sp.]HAD95778.1 hypothetical protein [Cryomorphaceae bacterium]|tara:strand:- start:6515 stop:8005 length:1491 start_codon:yes stop_codon:yes gene_type:complete